MLRRLGNKTRLLPKLLPVFPDNIVTFIDMFMGSGAVTFAMIDRCRYVIANDNDNDIFHLFMVVKDRKDELLEALVSMPVHESLFKHWKTTEESDPIWQAVRFLMLSNFGYMGQPDSLRFIAGDSKQVLLREIEGIFAKIQNIQFMCCDFREVIPKMSFQDDNKRKRAFIYADPPFLNTGNNYKNGFTEEDTHDLFSILQASGMRYAVSEFKHPYIYHLIKEHGLHVTSLGVRCNLQNRREEILITNYNPLNKQQELFS
jgi:DNA adenine methylase